MRYAAFPIAAPQAFSFVLGMYLIGIAAGAHWAAAVASGCGSHDDRGTIPLLAGLDLVLPWAAVAGLLADRSRALRGSRPR